MQSGIGKRRRCPNLHCTKIRKTGVPPVMADGLPGCRCRSSTAATVFRAPDSFPGSAEPALRPPEAGASSARPMNLSHQRMPQLHLATRCDMLPCCVALSCRPKCPAIAGSLFSQHLVADIHPARVHAIMIMVCDDINRETVIACHSSK